MRCKEICEKCHIYKDLRFFWETEWQERGGMTKVDLGTQWNFCSDAHCKFILEHKMVEWYNEV